MHNWRLIPVRVIEDHLTQHNNGSYPPSLEDLVRIAGQYRFQVVIVPKDIISSAYTLHSRHAILLPHTRPERMTAMLLHELFEILLRQPIAQEFIYPLSHQDEFHETACLGVKRSKL